MQINISSKHLDMTPTIEEYIKSKAEKLMRFYDRIEQRFWGLPADRAGRLDTRL